MKRYMCLLFTIMISVAVLLTSCGSQDDTQADVDDTYQLGNVNGYSTATDENTQPLITDSEPEPSISEEPVTPEPSPVTDNDGSSTPTVQPDPDASMSAELADNDDENLIALIAAMQASAPIIDAGEYNGIQVDNMFNLSNAAENEKYTTVTDDLKIVEIALQNADGKNWLEIGYTNCVPAIRYDSVQNRYEENPYDMVHPGWHHTYAVMYKCVWSDGTPRYGVYYISVYNDTDQELMAILCPIESVSDGLNMW